jgi:hypothetical protein
MHNKFCHSMIKRGVSLHLGMWCVLFVEFGLEDVHDGGIDNMYLQATTKINYLSPNPQNFKFPVFGHFTDLCLLLDRLTRNKMVLRSWLSE